MNVDPKLTVQNSPTVQQSNSPTVIPTNSFFGYISSIFNTGPAPHNVVPPNSDEDVASLDATNGIRAIELIYATNDGNDGFEIIGDDEIIIEAGDDTNGDFEVVKTYKISPSIIQILQTRENGFWDSDNTIWSTSCRHPSRFSETNQFRKFFDNLYPEIKTFYSWFDKKTTCFLYLNKSQLNKAAIFALFDKASKVFLNSKDDNKFVLASMMSSWGEHIRDGDLLSEEDNKSLRESHKLLFDVGDKINLKYPPLSKEIEISTFSIYNLNNKMD